MTTSRPPTRWVLPIVRPVAATRASPKFTFVDGSMTEIFGFTSGITQAIGAPRQILPQPGDQFTVLEQGDDLSLEGDAGRDKYVREGRHADL